IDYSSSTGTGNLGDLELPSTLESIGEYAFCRQQKGNLGEMVFPEGMKTIEKYAFYESSSLTGISLPSTLETIENSVFYKSGISGKVALDMETLSVGANAFYNCSGITELEISISDIKLGSGVFDNCSGMKKVTVPVDLAYSSGSSFGTTGAEEIHYTVGKTGVMPDRSTSNSADNYFCNTLEYGAMSTLKTVMYDEGITRIGDYAYYANTALTDVLFAKSVDSIGINCFHSLTKANVKFYGHKDSYAETYSNDIGVDFVPLFYPIITTETNEFLTGAGYTFEARTYSGVDQYTTDVSWSINGQNSDKTVIDENGLLKIAEDESADSITVIADNGTNKCTFEAKIKQHTHEYSSDPTFHWVDDYTACDAVVKCQICGSEKRYTCTVTKTSVPSSCSKEGKITYTANVTLSDREYTDIKEVSQDRLEHSVVKIEGYDPTCTEAGLTEGSYCSECGEVIKEQTSIDAIGHDLEKVDAVEPTEKLTGNIEYYICNVCSHIFKDANATEETSLKEVIIPAYGESHEHNWIEIMRQEPTCIASGLVTYVCQCSEKKEEMLDPLEHHIQVDDAVPATCTETGLTEGSHCSVCNTVLKAQKEIAAKGHTYKEVITRATLSSNGKIEKKCSRCGSVSSTTTIYRPTKFTLSTTAYTYDGGIKKPTVTVKNSAGRTLVKDTDYTLTYASGRKYVGKYSVKITLKGKYSGSKTLYFNINPPKTSLNSLTASSKGFTAKWSKKTTQVTGYQVQYSTSSKFTNPKTVTITKNSTTYKKITKLTAKKRYYVRVRTYKTVNSVKYYSSWSSYKYVTTKS
ncbi:MAG: leucine-rich repeat protein, partial [Eubacteriaceae bacterium]|nr:leucine-rich repeat protein [Eubacteriaceae bacterium]